MALGDEKEKDLSSVPHDVEAYIQGPIISSLSSGMNVSFSDIYLCFTGNVSLAEHICSALVSSTPSLF